MDRDDGVQYFLQQFSTFIMAQFYWWKIWFDWFDLLCLTPLSALFELYHGDQF
jgi:hypothetical protein